MRAKLLFEDKAVYPDGTIMEMRIWRLPAADPERPHGLKYSLYFGTGGVRLVGYDNERGKGDHRHFRGQESPYVFTSPERPIADFLRDVARVRSER